MLHIIHLYIIYNYMIIMLCINFVLPKLLATSARLSHVTVMSLGRPRRTRSRKTYGTKRPRATDPMPLFQAAQL